jgi:hypothetical protein
MSTRSLVPVIVGRWTTKSPQQPTQTFAADPGLTTQFDGKPRREIKVAERHLLAIKDLSFTAVICEGSVARLPPPRSLKSITAFKRGVTGTVDGQPLRIWRPRFGWTLASRALSVDAVDIQWSLVPDGVRSYHVADASGADLLRRSGEGLVADCDLPSGQLSLLLLVHVTGIALTSSLFWHVVQAL